MTEQEAKRLEVPTEWNGKANVCTYCGRVPETFYVATGHDHTDYDIRWCVCRDGTQYKSEIETLRTRLESASRLIEQLESALEYVDGCLSNRPVLHERIQEALAAYEQWKGK